MAGRVAGNALGSGLMEPFGIGIVGTGNIAGVASAFGASPFEDLRGRLPASFPSTVESSPRDPDEPRTTPTPKSSIKGIITIIHHPLTSPCMLQLSARERPTRRSPSP